MPFNNPIVAGTNLIREAIQSPNYEPGSSGWSVSRDGSAEFNGLQIRAGTGQARIELDGTTGIISIYNTDGELVGQLTPDQSVLLVNDFLSGGGLVWKIPPSGKYTLMDALGWIAGNDDDQTASRLDVFRTGEGNDGGARIIMWSGSTTPDDADPAEISASHNALGFTDAPSLLLESPTDDFFAHDKAYLSLFSASASTPSPRIETFQADLYVNQGVINKDLRAYKTTEPQNNSTTLQNDAELVIGLPNGTGTWVFEAIVWFQTTAASDFKLTFVGTGGVGEIRWSSTDSTQMFFGAQVLNIAQANTFQRTHIRGHFPSTTAGTLQLQWAQQTAGAGPTAVLKGSLLKVERVE